MSIYDNAGSLQCVKRAWMRESNWEWWLVHTDWCQHLLPNYIIKDGEENKRYSDIKHPIYIGRDKSGNTTKNLYKIERLFYGCYILTRSVFSIRVAV